MPVFPPLSLGERVDRAKERAGFLRARRSWTRERLQTGIPQTLAGPDYARLATLPAVTGPNLGRPAHVVVVPMEGPSFESYRPANFNLYYEAAQLLREDLGPASVSVFDVPPGEPPASWHMRLVDHVMDHRATHIITHAEHDPGVKEQWTWDVAWGALGRVWDGVLLGMMYDSSWDWIGVKSRLLARMSPRYLHVDICVPIDGVLVRGRPEVGPVNMPLSREAVAIVDERIAGVTPQWDVSFIGVMYDYRVRLVEQMRASGFSVAVNPHRPDRADDPDSSRANQPSWPDYMAGLRSSRMTINFSQSNAGRYEQLKTRVIEATLAGTLLLTDDIDRTARFWTEGEEYAYFATPDDLPRVAQRYLDDPALRDRVAAAGAARARELVHGFWPVIDTGLARRGLPLVGVPAGGPA